MTRSPASETWPFALPSVTVHFNTVRSSAMKIRLLTLFRFDFLEVKFAQPRPQQRGTDYVFQ